MSRVISGFALLAALTLAGCGASDHRQFTDNSRDPEALATNIKQVVLTAIYESESAREPADALSMVVVSLDGKLSKMPVGNYASVYEELLAVSSELHQACEQVDGRAPGLDAGLKRLAELAEQLPGDVEPLK